MYQIESKCLPHSQNLFTIYNRYMARISFKAKITLIGSFLALSIIGVLYAYITTAAKDRAEKESDFFMMDLEKQKSNGCKSIVDNYCHQLHSNEARGNLRIKNKDLSEALTTAGSTINNFDSAVFAYHKARIKQKNKLPKDLLAALEKRAFYEDLTVLLSRPSRKNMNSGSRIYYGDLENNVDSKWDQAVEEVVLRRLAKKFPQIYTTDDANIPREIEVEYTRVYYSLWTEISKALWSNDVRWIKIKALFDQLKISFSNVIKDMNVSDDVKESWIKKVNSVLLRTPGFNPAVASRDCISASRNAYYYPYLNTITICAGYLNTGEQIQTLAHELAHSIDQSSRLIDHLKSSSMLSSFVELRQSLCKKKDFKCEQWTQFGEKFKDNLAQLADHRKDVYSFHRCLKINEATLPFDGQAQERLASKITSENFSTLIKSSAFFRIIKKSIPVGYNSVRPNPSFMNPCDYYTWDLDVFAPDGELASLLMFTAAFQCVEGDDIFRMRAAIDQSKQYAQEITSVLLGLEGEFSSRDEMQEERYSSSPNERFADRIGSAIVADYLKTFHSKENAEDLRSLFLASSYWLCDKPTLRTTHLEEYQSLSDIIIDKSVHEDNSNRIKDWLSPALREILACEKDFEHAECSIY